MRRRSSSRCSSCAPSIFWKSLGAKAIGSSDSATKFEMGAAAAAMGRQRTLARLKGCIGQRVQ